MLLLNVSKKASFLRLVTNNEQSKVRVVYYSKLCAEAACLFAHSLFLANFNRSGSWDALIVE